MVVVDINVLVAATRSNLGAFYKILTMMVERNINYLISVPLFLEYEAVLKRPSI